jgi:hypothetical protein
MRSLLEDCWAKERELKVRELASLATKLQVAAGARAKAAAALRTALAPLFHGAAPFAVDNPNNLNHPHYTDDPDCYTCNPISPCMWAPALERLIDLLATHNGVSRNRDEIFSPGGGAYDDSLYDAVNDPYYLSSNNEWERTQGWGLRSQSSFWGAHSRQRVQQARVAVDILAYQNNCHQSKTNSNCSYFNNTTIRTHATAGLYLK